MKAVTWQGKHDIQVKDVPDPKIQDPRDIISASDDNGDLRLGPSHLRRLHSDNGGRRHPWP